MSSLFEIDKFLATVKDRWNMTPDEKAQWEYLKSRHLEIKSEKGKARMYWEPIVNGYFVEQTYGRAVEQV